MSFGMIPRKKLDLAPRHFVRAYAETFRKHDRTKLEERVKVAFGTSDAVVALSVRSAFDALLSCLRLPPGSEVLVSAITIPHMVDILRAHRLVPVPVDLDPNTLVPSASAFEAARSERTRAVLFAHLFGSRADLRQLCSWAAQHHLHVIEDAAQAYAADGWTGHAQADVSLFSFGTSKTATALAGGIAVIRDPVVRETVEERLHSLPARPVKVYRRRVLRFALLSSACQPQAYAMLHRALRWSGREPDATIMALSRGFSGPDFFGLIRQAPSGAALALLAHRLEHPEPDRVRWRAHAGRRFVRHLPASMSVGRLAERHTHWLFPVRVPDPELFCCRLRARGIDATCGASSLIAVAPASGVAAPRAHALIRDTAYLPLPQLGVRQRYLEAVQEVLHEGRSTEVRHAWSA